MNETNREIEAELKKEKINELFNQLASTSKTIRNERKNLLSGDFNRSYKTKKRELAEQHSEFQKIIEVIFKINSFVHSHEAINYQRERLVSEQKKKELINLVSWQHQAIEVLVEMGWDKIMTDKFWQQVGYSFETFSRYPDDFEGYKRGVTGQAQVFLILRELGYNPKLATPSEDAFEGTDLYISLPGKEDKIRTQIKTSSLQGESLIELVDCGSPSVVLNSRDGRSQTRFETDAMLNMTNVREKCGDLSIQEGKQVKSLLVIINEADFDAQTGRPTQALLKKFEQIVSKIV